MHYFSKFLYNNSFTSKKVVLAETLTKIYKDIHRIVYNFKKIRNNMQQQGLPR